MADYEVIYTDGLLYVNGLNISKASNTTLSVSAGQCRDSTNTFDVISSSAITINSAANGVNGLDTGTFAASKMYYVFLIYDNTNGKLINPAALISLSATDPVLPGGYGYFRRIGSWRSNGSTQFVAGYQSGNDNNRFFFYDAPVAVLTGGAATTTTEIDLLNVVPAFDNQPVYLFAAFTGSAAGRQLSVGPYAQTLIAFATCQVSAVVITEQFVVPALLDGSDHPAVSYTVTNASDAATVSVHGYVDIL